MIKISIGTNKKFKATSYVLDDKTVKSEVKPYKFNLNNVHIDNLKDLTHALRQITVLAQKQGRDLAPEETLIVEMKDKSVINWANSSSAPLKYSKDMIVFLGVLDTIPCSVQFIYQTSPVAVHFATQHEYNRTQEHFSHGLDDLLLVSDE